MNEMKILYVEDNSVDADLTRRWLQQHAPHFTLVTAETERDAIALLMKPEKTPYDLVLTDLRLPDGNGLSLLAYIRLQMLPYAVVVITSGGDEETAATALKAGADDYIVKRNDYLARLPFALEDALQRYRAHTARQSRPISALYAEHYSSDIDLTCRHLQRYAPHIRLDVVRTGTEALERLSQSNQAREYDVLLLDYRLPGLNALEVLKEIRQDRGMDIPVVLVTGQGDEEVAMQALKLGATSYLVKNPGYLYQLSVELENAFYRAELVREQAALSESEARNRAMLEAIPDLMFLQSRDGVYLDFHAGNPSGLLVPPEAFLGKSMHDVIPPKLAERFQKGFIDLAESEEPFVVEYSLPISGEERQYEARIVNCSNDRILSLVRDVTDRKRAEQALRESEERFRSAFDHAAIGMALVGLDLRPIEVNHSLCELLGYSEQELLATDFESLTYPDDLDRCIAQVRRVLDGEARSFQMEKRYIHKRGHPVWVLVSVSVLRDANGQPLYFISQVQDIHERKQAEERLRESEDRFRALADSAPVPIWVNGANAGCEFVNEAYLDFFGKTLEEVRGFGWRPHTHPDDAERYSSSYIAAFDARAPFRSEARFLNAKGDYRWLDSVGLPRYSAAGEFLGYVGASPDITEIKRTELNTQFINQLSFELTRIADADEIIRLATSRLGEYLGVDSCYVIEVNQTANLAILRENWIGWYHSERNIVGEYHIDDYVTPEFREALAAGQATIVKDVTADSRTCNFVSGYEALGVGAFISVPALNEKRWEASLTVNYSRPRDWRPDETQLMRDIAARLWPAFKRARAIKALRESEERLRFALEAGRMGVWEWDTRTNAVKWTKENFWIFGLAPFSIEPDYYAWADRVHPDDLPMAVGEINKAIAMEGEFRYEYRVIWPDGSVHWVEDRGRPVYDKNGQCVKVSGLILDITDRKESERALRESEEALRQSYSRIEDLAGRLITSQEEERRHIARELHDDLNQQVAALAIGISRLKRQLSKTDALVFERLKLLEKTDSLSERIRQVSHELHSSILQHAGLHAALNSFCAEFSDQEGISVRLDIEGEVDAVQPDAALCLYRVAQESLRNIARHSGARSAVVALSGVNGAIELRVSDQGVGFDPAHARERRGLGLISMEERVKLLHGSLVLTTRPGAGTELRAQIPIRRGHE